MARAVFPGANPRKLGLLALAVALVAPGCGGGSQASAEQRVAGDGYSFRAPADWRVTRRGRTVGAHDGASLVQVATFPLAQRFDASRWGEYVSSSDHAAAQVAAQEKAKLERSETTTVGGQRARTYDLSRGAVDERLVFLFRGRREYELFCHDAGSACDRLVESFSLEPA